MQKFLVASIAAAALLGAGAAIAQYAPPAPPAPIVQPAPPGSPLRLLQPQTRNEVVEKVREHFARLDTDRDGYLTKDEARAGHARMKVERIKHIRSAEGGHAPMK